ncbi:MAG: hypothetical protein JWM76_3530 [Pseudonocardiales bacterium]|nr:hypothetical protein [Pseudonocardiales bacterium]
MRLLLPPSEGKTTGGRGAPLASGRYGEGELGEWRRFLCEMVESTARGPRAEAVATFRLPAAVADDALAANAVVTTSGTRAALDRYAGVVYEGLAVPAMTPAQRRIANRSILIFSGLFGVVTGGEAIPNYRVPAATKLVGRATLGSFWRPVLPSVMPERLGRKDFVIDLRSTDYAAMWRPELSPAHDRFVTVRMLSPTRTGRLAVVSYFSKHAKGRLANALIAREADGYKIRSVDDVVQIWLDGDGADAKVVDEFGSVRLDLITRPV